MNIPYNRIRSTLGTARKYAVTAAAYTSVGAQAGYNAAKKLGPASAYMAVGAAVGGITYASGGNKTGSVGMGIASGGAAALLHQRYKVQSGFVNKLQATMDRMRNVRRGL